MLEDSRHLSRWYTDWPAGWQVGWLAGYCWQKNQPSGLHTHTHNEPPVPTLAHYRQSLSEGGELPRPEIPKLFHVKLPQILLISLHGRSLDKIMS